MLIFIILFFLMVLGGFCLSLRFFGRRTAGVFLAATLMTALLFLGMSAATDSDRLRSFFCDDRPTEDEARVPILMYHHISDTFESSVTVTPETFLRQIQALSDAGYTAVSFAQLEDYVLHGGELAENPVVITFDDGYASNLEIAAPILESMGWCAEIAVIGENVGTSTEELSWFTMEDARPWVEKGVLEIGAHSYGLHHNESRLGVQRKFRESRKAYARMFDADTETVTRIIEDGVGVRPRVYAYPYGYHNPTAERELARLGYTVTLTVREGINTLVRGEPQSLRGLKRHNVTQDTSPEELVRTLEEWKEA